MAGRSCNFSGAYFKKYIWMAYQTLSSDGFSIPILGKRLLLIDCWVWKKNLQKSKMQWWTSNWEFQTLSFRERVNRKWTTYITLTGIYMPNLFLLNYKKKASGFCPLKAFYKLKGVWSGWGGHNWGHWTHSKLCHWNFPVLVGCQMVVGQT